MVGTKKYVAIVAVAVVGYLVWMEITQSGTGDVDDPDGGDGFSLDDVYAGTVGAVMAAVSASSVSQNGINLIAGQEGCKLTAYPDAGGYSIGYGHHAAVSAGQTCTQDQANAWLASDAASAANTVLRYVRVPLNQNQLDALTDFVYNVGAGHFAGSTLLTLLNGGDYDDVPAQLARWNQSQGVVNSSLVSRRQAEADLWSTPVDGSSSGTDSSTDATVPTDGSDDDGSDSGDDDSSDDDGGDDD